MRQHKYFEELMLIGVLLSILLLHYLAPIPFIDRGLLLGATVLGTAPVFWNALKALLEREWASMDMLASLALIFSLIQGQWASAVFISLMLAAARLLEKVTEERTEQSIRGLLKLRPATAKIERDGKTRVYPVEAIRVGDTVVVDVGERVAIDGSVISGEGTVDESSLTGESLPVDKEVGSHVASSTLVTSGSLRIETKKIGRDTTLERIIALVESSQAEKPAIETLGQRFGKAYLIVVFLGAAILFALTRNVSLVLAVVLVVCADDIALAIPLSYLRAIGSAAKRGIIIKGGRHLEALGQADTLIFDKTGTLTHGKPRVTSLHTGAGVTEKMLLHITMPVALRSTHPLSRALVAYAKEHHIAEATAVMAEVVGGKGIIAETTDGEIIFGKKEFLQEQGVTFPDALETEAEAQSNEGKSLSYVAQNKSVIGFVAFSDTVKSHARTVLAELRTLGIKHIVMLSGDNERAARVIADEIGVDAYYANLLPEDKVARVKILNQSGTVVMVGDGVNDAAALSLAHVGIAMGGLGSDGAIESANIVLMHDNLSAIPETIRLARLVRRISIQDFFIWGATNLIGLSLVFTGFIGPAGAAAYNFISDFFPLANAIRARLPYNKK